MRCWREGVHNHGMDGFLHFAEAAEAYAGLVDHIRTDQWEGPGLGVWNVRALVGHGARALLTVETYLERPAADVQLATPVDYLTAIRAIGATAGGDPEAVAERGRQAGAALGDDPAAAVRAIVARVLPRVEQAGQAGDPRIETIGGGMLLSAYLPTRTFELVVHGLDVARATNQSQPSLGTELLEAVTAMATGAAVRHGDGAALLLALTGREPLPAGFAVV